MNNIKFEFGWIQVLNPTDRIKNKLNEKFDSGESFTIKESLYFYKKQHDLEQLSFAGQNGWQIKSILSKERDDGIVELYCLERNSKHESFGKMTLNDEYSDSELYKKQYNEREELMERNIK